MQGEFFEIKPHPPLLSLSSSDRGGSPKNGLAFNLRNLNDREAPSAFADSSESGEQPAYFSGLG